MFLTETLKFSNYNHRIVKPVPSKLSVPKGYYA